MVGDGQVVVDGLGRTHDRQPLDVVAGDVIGKLVDGVHRVVAADVDKVGDVARQQRIDDRFELGIFCIVELEPAGAQRSCRSVAEQVELFRRSQRLRKVDKVSGQNALDAVSRAVDAVHLRTGQAALHHAGDGGVDGSGRSTRLGD